MGSLKEPWDAVRARITQVAQSCARAPEDIRLLAVSKTFGVDAIREVAGYGQRDFGENYIQEAVEKIQLLRTDPVTQHCVWHCIGPIQATRHAGWPSILTGCTPSTA